MRLRRGRREAKTDLDLKSNSNGCRRALRGAWQGPRPAARLRLRRSSSPLVWTEINWSWFARASLRRSSAAPLDSRGRESAGSVWRQQVERGCRQAALSRRAPPAARSRPPSSSHWTRRNCGPNCFTSTPLPPNRQLPTSRPAKRAAGAAANKSRRRQRRPCNRLIRFSD